MKPILDLPKQNSLQNDPNRVEEAKLLVKKLNEEKRERERIKAEKARQAELKFEQEMKERNIQIMTEQERKEYDK